MEFWSARVEDICIEAAAIDTSRGGYRACVYLRDAQTDSMLWLDEGLFGGLAFPTATEALVRALEAGRLEARRFIEDRPKQQP